MPPSSNSVGQLICEHTCIKIAIVFMIQYVDRLRIIYNVHVPTGNFKDILSINFIVGLIISPFIIILSIQPVFFPHHLHQLMCFPRCLCLFGVLVTNNSASESKLSSNIASRLAWEVSRSLCIFPILSLSLDNSFFNA